MLRLSQNKKIKYLLVFIVLVLFLCFTLLVLEKTRTTDIVKMPESSEKKEAEKKLKEEQDASKASKQAYLDNANGQSISKNLSNPDSQTQSLRISANQDGDIVTVLSKVYGFSGGECLLKITNGTKENLQKASLIFQPEFSSCAGFSVNKDILGLGSWQISIVLSDTNGNTVSHSTSLEVK